MGHYFTALLIGHLVKNDEKTHILLALLAVYSPRLSLSLCHPELSFRIIIKTNPLCLKWVQKK